MSITAITTITDDVNDAERVDRCNLLNLEGISCGNTAPKGYNTNNQICTIRTLHYSIVTSFVTQNIQSQGAILFKNLLFVVSNYNYFIINNISQALGYRNETIQVKIK